VSTNKKKICVITGAAGGIGRALVDVFSGAGFDVIALDKAPRATDLVCSQYCRGDLERFVDDEVYAAKLILDIKTALNGRPLDALINNAAVQILGGLVDLTRADWDKTLSVNLLAPFLLSQAFLTQLDSANGCVINIGSIHARLTKKNFVAYSTSKAALAGMTRALAVDIGPSVRINAIEPAAIETEMLKVGFKGKPDAYNQLENCHPQQRIGQPEEVAQLALAIIDGGVNFLHGACIGIDGGVGSRLFDPD